MKKLIPIFILTSLLILLFVFMPKLTSQQLETKDSSDFYYAPGKIVIQFTTEVSPVTPWKEAGIIQTGIASVDYLCQKFKVHTMRRQFPAPKYPNPDLTRHFVVKFDESENLDQVLNAFSKIPFFIAKVEKVGVHKFLSQPNDDLFNLQWHLNQGNDCDIDAPEAWCIQKGSENVILAIPDSGVLYTHEDLNDNIWINLYEYYGTEGVDDDPDGGNDYIDDIYGWDFYGDGDNEDNDPTDEEGHGTHCAGIAAAETNNIKGVAGVAGGWDPEYGQKGCRIMCLRVGHNGVDMSCAAEAFYYATDMGASIINCSWPGSNTGGLGDAIDYALENGILLIVASAGNENADNPSYLGIREDIMDVGATNREDERATYSNYGEWVDVSAPGGDPREEYEGDQTQEIYSTRNNGSYEWRRGTSQAAAMVTGLSGLIKSERFDWGRDKIWDAIVKTTDPIVVDEYIGSGRINAHHALKQTWSPSAPSNLDAEAVAYNQINLSWVDNSDNEIEFIIERTTDPPDFSDCAIVEKNVTSYQDESVLDETTYYYRIKAHNVSGDSSWIYSDPVTTPPIPPAAPSNLLAYGYCWEVKLTWQDNSDNEDGFKIYRRSGTEYYYLAWVGPNVTTYWDIELYCGQHWCYKVRAFRNGSNSPFSNATCDWTEPCYQCGYPMSLKIIPDKENINLGESVTYSYVIENKGSVDLTDIELIDDKFGIIATKFDLKTGEAKDFIITIILTESTTDCVEATALWHYENKSGSIKTHACATVEVRK